MMSTAEIATPLRIGADSAGMLLTPEEFDAITDYDDNYRYELIHEVLVVNPIPLEAEADPNEELGYLLRDYRDHHPNGKVLDLTLFERYLRVGNSRRRADRVIWTGLGRRPNPKLDVPTIAVEFVSRGKRDRQRDYVEKRTEYAGIGVVEYWIIDRFERKMTVYRNSETGSEEIVVTEKQTYNTELLPGFELPLAHLLAVADVWEDEE